MPPANVLPPPGPALTKRQRFRPVPLLVAAVLLALAAQLNLQRGAAVEGALWYVLAGAAFLRSLAHSSPAFAPASKLLPLPGLSRLRLLALVAGLAVSAVAGWTLGAGDQLSAWLFVFLAGILAAAAAADTSAVRQPALASSAGDSRQRTVWLAGLVLVTLLALALRVIGLDAQPLGIWYDEANIGLEAARIVNEASFRPLYSEGTTSPAPYTYLVSWAIAAFGQNAVALRLVSALAGTLTVPVVALLLREFGGVRLALAGAFLLAVSRWDITFSRLAMQGVTTPLIACLTLWLLVSGLRRGSAARLLLAGVTLGIGLLFYTAFLLFPLVAAFAAAVLLVREPQRLRSLAPGVALFAVAFVAAAMPFVSFAVHHRDELLERPAAASVLRTTDPQRLPGVLLDSAGKHIGMFHFRGDHNGRHNLPNAPMLEAATGILAALGLAVALNAPLAPLHAIIFVWLAAALLPGILSIPHEAPQGLRAIGTVPPVLALAAIGFDQIAGLAGNALGPHRRRTLGIGVMLAGCWIAGVNSYVYFIVQAQDYDAWASHSTAQTILGYRLKELPPERYDVLASGLFFQHLSTSYLNPDGYTLKHFDLASSLPLTSTKEATVLFIEPRDRTAVVWLQRLYPDARCHRVTSQPELEQTLMDICVVPRAAVERMNGLEVRYQETHGGNEATGFVPDLTLDWNAAGPARTPFRAFWAGALHAPESGVYSLRAAGNAPVSIRLDDLPVLDGPPGTVGRVELAKGLHQLTASADVTASQGKVRLEWQRPGMGWEPLPASAVFRPPTTPVGLTGSYFPNADWSGPPSFRRVDWGIGYYWHLTPLPRPYSVEWTGHLRAPEAGRYRLGLRAVSNATLEVNGRAVLAAGSGAGEVFAEVELTAGLHPIRVRYADLDNYSQVYLLWIPPGGRQEPVPVEMLRPW